MDHKKKSMLIELMELDFCIVETNLYLDTHPNDENALRLHNTLVKKYKELEKIYEFEFGPLTGKSMSKYPWQYINSPWPWDMEF